MSLKFILLCCAFVILVGDVKSDCDDYLKCLGDFIHNFFGYKENNSTVTYINDTREYGDTQNIFEIPDLQKSLNQILAEVTTLIKDEIKGKQKIESESDTFKTVDNDTEVLIKYLDLSEIPYYLHNKDDIFDDNDTTRTVPALIDEDAGSLNYSDEYLENWVVNGPETPIHKSIDLIKISTLIVSTDKYETDNISNNTNDDNTSRFNLDITTESSLRNTEHSKELQLNSNHELKNNQALVLNKGKEKALLPKVVHTRYPVDDPVEESLIAIESKDQLKTNNNNRSHENIHSFYPNFIPLSIIQYEEYNDLSNSTSDILNKKNEENISNIETENNELSKQKPDKMEETLQNVKMETTTYNKQENVAKFEVKIPENITNYSKLVPDIIDLNPLAINNVTKTVVSFNVTHTYDIQILNTTKLKVNDTSQNTNDKDILIPYEDFEEYYNDIQDDNATDYPIIDYIELYKDTTNEDVEYKPTETPTIEANGNSEKVSDLDNAIEYSLISEEGLRSGRDNAVQNRTNAAEVYSWIASVYVKNGTSNQFDYYCDGALLSKNVILTAARCVSGSNATLDAGNLIIIVGKRSLQTTEDGERVHRVKQIKVHTNFTSSDAETENDLAILVLEVPVEYSSAIQAASLESGEIGEYGESFTSGWAFSGNLTAVHFDPEKSRSCNKNSVSVNTFCATYGNDVTTCPSYGGLYVTRLSKQWTLQGIRTGNPADRNFCIDKTVLYTSLISYTGWIYENIDLNKDY